MKEDIIINNYYLDEEQKKPILENPKYSLIIAGAGSGKTLTLVGKLKYMLENNLIKPYEVCPISFTNEAVLNMHNNILKNCHVNIPTYTFHKLALKIINDLDFMIADDNLKDIVIDHFFNSNFKENEHTKKSVYSILKIYGPFKNFQYQKKNLKPLKKVIKQFLDLYSSNTFSKEDWLNFFKVSKKHHLLIILYAIYNLYEKEKSQKDLIDFDDMIRLAIKRLKNEKPKLPYKLILIDEFQDTSLLRFNLIRELVKLNNASLCVCGDDYQSIYHFSGSDINLFLNFKKYYPQAKIYKLETTYRNSQELVNVAGNFILKNPNQIDKHLKSKSHLANPIYVVYEKNYQETLNKIINLIPKEDNIFILGRTHYDLKKYTNKDYKEGRIKFYTIHASKGLESDHVIILNMIDGMYGFPSKQKDDIVLSLVKKDFTYPFEEERRLFYTALTRAKKDVYLITNKYNPSLFIKEIIKEKEVKILKV